MATPVSGRLDSKTYTTPWDITQHRHNDGHEGGQHAHHGSAMTSGRDGLPRINGITEFEAGNTLLIYFHGLVAHDVKFDVGQQVRSALDEAARALRKAGGLPTHILSVDINLADAEHFAIVMVEWSGWAESERVAVRPGVFVRPPADGWLVDLDVVAAFSRRKPERVR